jgi:hypothetical protein
MGLPCFTGAREFLSAVSVLAVAQPISEVLGGLKNYPVYVLVVFDAVYYSLSYV